jgi:hypothetical protein
MLTVIIIVISFVLASLCISLWPTGMTIWALMIALLVGELSQKKKFSNLDTYIREGLVFVIPIGMIQAITNRQVGLK